MVSYCARFGIPSSVECASWVQAWASVVAILAAVAVVLIAHGLQVRKQKREAFDAHTQYLDVLCHLMVSTLAQANHLIAEQHRLLHAHGEAKEEVDRARIYEAGMRMVHLAHVHAEAMISALERFNLERVDRGVVISGFMATDSFMRELRSVLNATSRTAHLWPRVAPEIVQLCEIHGDVIHKHFLQLQEVLKIRGKVAIDDEPPGAFRWLRRRLRRPAPASIQKPEAVITEAVPQPEGKGPPPRDQTPPLAEP